jgi:hypothetical protein
MTRMIIRLVGLIGVLSASVATWADVGLRLAQATGTAPATTPKGVGEAAEVTVRGKIAAIDKANQTVTLQGPKGRQVTLHVQDPTKLEAVKVGDPVVAKYFESVVIQAKKSSEGAPGVSTQEARVSSKPGETPAGAIGRQITITGTVTGIDRKRQTVTVKGPGGRVETLKVQDPKRLEGLKVGHLAELTYTQALAVSLDKPAAKK